LYPLKRYFQQNIKFINWSWFDLFHGQFGGHESFDNFTPNIGNGHNLCFGSLIWEFNLTLLSTLQDLCNGLKKVQFGQGWSHKTFFKKI
jgi:hypothetical protein